MSNKKVHYHPPLFRYCILGRPGSVEMAAELQSAALFSRSEKIPTHGERYWHPITQKHSECLVSAGRYRHAACRRVLDRFHRVVVK